MQRSTEIDLDGTFRLLSTLVKAELAANSEGAWMDSGFSLKLRSPTTNAAGTRVQVTSDFIENSIDREILVEGTEEWTSGGAIHNSVGLLDKMVRIVDNAGVGTVGTLVISLEWA